MLIAGAISHLPDVFVTALTSDTKQEQMLQMGVAYGNVP